VKKGLAVLLLVLAPALGFADLQIGPSLLYAPSVSSTTLASPSIVNLPFGVEARYRFLHVFQFSTTMLLCADTAPYLIFLTDLGFTVDIDRFTIGGAIGPDFFLGLTGSRAPESSVINFRLTGDMSFGPVTVGIVLSDPVSTLSELKTSFPWIGITVLYTLY
jgi:hypothetical protein